MVYVSTVLYTLAKMFSCLASACELASAGFERQLGNPSIPDQLFILLVLVVFSCRRAAAVWALCLGCWVTYSLEKEDRIVLQILSHAGDFSVLLSR